MIDISFLLLYEKRKAGEDECETKAAIRVMFVWNVSNLVDRFQTARRRITEDRNRNISRLENLKHRRKLHINFWKEDEI
jgi:hypothetical protein